MRGRESLLFGTPQRAPQGGVGDGIGSPNRRRPLKTPGRARWGVTKSGQHAVPHFSIANK